MRNRLFILGLTMMFCVSLSQVGQPAPANAAVINSVPNINADIDLEAVSGIDLSISGPDQIVTVVLVLDSGADQGFSCNYPDLCTFDEEATYDSVRVKGISSAGVLQVSGLVSNVNIFLDNLTVSGTSYNLRNYFLFANGLRLSGEQHYFAKSGAQYVATGLFATTKVSPSSTNNLSTIRVLPSLPSATYSLAVVAGSPSGTYLKDPTTGNNVSTITYTGTGSQVNDLFSRTTLVTGSSVSGIQVSFNGNSLLSFASATSVGCSAGTYSPTGDNSIISCITPVDGFYAAEAGAVIPFPAPRGYYASGGVMIPCAAGTYSSSSGSAACTPAPQGAYVGGTGWTSFAECSAGTFATGTGNATCTPARAGYYVSSGSSGVDTPCSAGTYQPNTGSTGCITSSAGFYVGASASSSQTACASGYTSNAGASSCTAVASSGGSSSAAPVAESAPVVVANPECRVAVKGKATVACLLASIGKSQPAGSKASLTVTSNKSACKVSGTKVQGKKVGACNVRVTLKPKKGAKTVYATTLNVG